MRKVAFIISMFVWSCTFGQYGNEWINYSRPHFKVEVTTEGMHQITANTLASVGLNFINANNFRMFRDGVEIPIYVNATGVNVNYIEFYGYPNDGKLDAALYRDPDWQMHQHSSLFTNQAVYYLTYNNFGGNERINDTPNNLINLPAAESYYLHTARRLFDNAFSTGEPVYISGGTLYNSLFDNGEGYMASSSEQFNNTTLNKSYLLSTPHYNTSGPAPSLKTVVIGTTNQEHEFLVKIGNTQLANEQFSGFKLVRTDVTLTSSLVGPTTTVNFESVPTATGTNRNTPSLIEITYPRNFQFDNASQVVLEIEGNGAVQYLQLGGLNDLGSNPILYDVTNGYRIISTDAPGAANHRFALPAATGTRKIVVRANNATTVTNIPSVAQVNMSDFSNLANQGTYIVLSHESLIGTPEFQDYINYRSSTAGGSHAVVVVDIEELYHQFAWGIDKHPQAIRNFVQYAVDNWSFTPEYLFIMAKGREYPNLKNSASARAACLVPTFGNPGSDVLLASVGNSSAPSLAVGRLAAQVPADISLYYNKVLEYEGKLNEVGDPFQTVADKDYQKQILHFGGGNDGVQQAQFTNYLNMYKAAVEDTLWGANVFSVFKTTSNPLQNVQSDFLRDRIDDGVSLVTFFGHSYAGGFDVSFDEPENYTNSGKYPIFLANGCNAGIIHSATLSISERFVLAEQKGAIAYLSTTALSSSLSLNNYSSRLYDSFTQLDYNTTIGKSIQATVTELDICCSNSAPNMMVAQEMTLHGDPAIRWNQYPEPDYNIEANNVFFEPNNITTSIDSFQILLDVYNLGRAINETFSVEITRLFPDGSQEIYTQSFQAPLYRDTLAFTLPVTNGLSGLGLNQFNIFIDADDVVPNELSETNNVLNNEVSLVIGSDAVFPIYPYEFAIVPEQGVTLKASTGNPLSAIGSYTFEIDTSEVFTTPLETGSITSGGGVVSWQTSLNMQDSVVYYWRVKSDNVSAPNWQTSSFIYIANEFPGWNQSHYYQWLKDDFRNVYVDVDRVFKYEDDIKEIFVQTGAVNFNEMKWVLNGAKQHNWQMNNCGGGVGYPNGFTIAVIDNSTGLPVDVVNSSATSYGPFGNIHCVGATDIKTVANFRAYGDTPASHPNPGTPWSSVILDYLNNEVPNGFYVLIYSINNPRFDLMDQSLLDYLNSRGAAVTNATSGPMVLAYRENGASSNTFDFTVGTSFSDIVSTSFVISGTWNSGDFSSPVIGPALSWGSFHWRYSALENPTTDAQNVVIYGTTNPNDFGTPIMTVSSNTLDTSINSIDALTYPYLRLQLASSDATDRTPTQPEYWRVIYDQAPELAINPNRFFEVASDTIDQGNVWNVAVALENVSGYDMDSTWTKYTKRYGDNSVSQNYVRNAALPSLDTLYLTFSENTLEGKFKGNNQLTIEANPLDFNHEQEQFHFNNFLQLDYDVVGDQENPLLDVTFDGIRILDGDIVSSKPEIAIQLKDENQFLALDDTSLVDIYFRRVEPDLQSLDRVNFADPDVTFIPADLTSSSNNKALVNIRAEFPVNGTYELVVRSADKSGNGSSGTSDRIIDLVYYDYKIRFEVINETTISNVLNYPNPFTTQTQFVFTLTGSVLPDYFEIQISNVKGTVVRQITMDELGPIHIGLNKTAYAWDGRDEYGDLLANGVYFYRIITSLNNQDIDPYAIEQVDGFFERGIGKMVMIR